MSPFKPNNVVIFSGSSHPSLAREIADTLDLSLGQLDLQTFPDGEISVQVRENVRGRNCFVVQSIALRPNDYLMELLVIMDALKRASARRVVPVISYFGYARQDRKDRPRVPITAKLVADLLQVAGASRVLAMDLHADQVQGFFDVPVDHLQGRPELVRAVRALDLDPLVVVAPDVGSIKRARSFATQLGTELAIVDKRRMNAEEVEFTTLIGDVDGYNVVLVDDICSTGGTLINAAEACCDRGAKRVIAAVTHPLMVGSAVHQLEESCIEKLFVGNTIPVEGRVRSSKVEEVSVASLFGKAIQYIEEGRSIASLFTL